MIAVQLSKKQAQWQTCFIQKEEISIPKADATKGTLQAISVTTILCPETQDLHNQNA